MKNRYYTIYIVFSIAFFLFLFSFSAYNLTQKHKDGTEKGLAYFNRIKNSITTSYLSNNDFSSSAFRRSISNFFDSNKSFQSLAIYDNNGKMEYFYIRNPYILAENPVFTNDFMAKPKYKFNSFFFNLFSSSIIIPGSNNLNIEAVYNIINYNEISNYIKILIICMLAYIILTASFLLFVPYGNINLNSTKTDLKEKKDSVATSSETQTPESQATDNSDIIAIKYTPLINEINKSINNSNKEKSSNTVTETINNSGAAKNNPIHTNIPELDTIIDTLSPIVKVDESTGLASIDDFNPKLSYELDKATANDTDLSVLMLAFISEDNERITVFFNNLPLLLRNFSMPQMAFKVSRSKLSIIMPEKTIEESIKKADEFIGRLKNISTIENIYAGISSRNSRIISAERLIKEADGAIAKAISGPDHIVAFKSDPEKFREMLTKQHSV